MTDIEFKIQIVRKLNDIQEKVENQGKATRKTSHRMFFRHIFKNISTTERTSGNKNSLTEFQNAIESFNKKLDQAEEII